MTSRGLRAAARAAGQPTYYTNKPCHRGHRCARYTSSGQCVECVNPGSRRRDRLIAAAHGLRTMPMLCVHPDDYDTLLAHARILNAQRGLPPPDGFRSPSRGRTAKERNDALAARAAPILGPKLTHYPPALQALLDRDKPEPLPPEAPEGYFK